MSQNQLSCYQRKQTDKERDLKASGVCRKVRVGASAKAISLINVRITHKTAHVPLLEAVSFKDDEDAYAQMRSLDGVQESVLIQTCNRIELFLVSEDEGRSVKSAVECLANRASTHTAEASKAIEYSLNRDALLHLLRVTSGLESMVIGEDQVINQVWDAYLKAEKANAVGPVLNMLFNRAVNVGRRARSKTSISKGAGIAGSGPEVRPKTG